MNIQLSQVILIIAIVLFVLYVFKVRTVLTDRIIYVLLVSGGAVLVVYPDLSTYVARSIGIGRGTDLILYIFVILSLFNHVNLVSRIRTIERHLTVIVRAAAIEKSLAASQPREEMPEPRGLPTGGRNDSSVDGSLPDAI